MSKISRMFNSTLFDRFWLAFCLAAVVFEIVVLSVGTKYVAFHVAFLCIDTACLLVAICFNMPASWKRRLVELVFGRNDTWS